ncbi:Sulfoxide reductase heme-binding subunit YedZ [Vibrio aerogenes CECT 7868]|uniref:Protein-methionine-sulfoxide reductase heme-binding subunit MsrQ n=1 Tax=Vibrio aerogenes CECT 7868 TaxID=1216006 RepID=A0A1M5ZI04_9VIBR|nr:protein-methionine-sulfoxide reductase heme-binding subunit MsrQ [Vibrio aerogenes]SHI23754.1 Sulfoxide reductase heme-binding subunit YedZ [Vibrio aerogenes CECT 7868]
MSVTIRRWVIFFAACLPAIALVVGAVHQTLGADPAKTIVWETGQWALRFLLITLAVSPLVRYLKWRWLMIHRRMLGLFSLFYAVLHLLAYYQFILGGNLLMLGSEIVHRPYILAGAPAILMLIILGVTSTQGWMKRLGKRWQQLHRLIYPALVLAWIHLFWQVRASYQDAFIYGVLGGILLAIRFPRWQAQWKGFIRKRHHPER